MAGTLLILNDPPYGAERSYNALRLARALLEKGAGTVRVFLMGDAASCAQGGPKVPAGYYNIGDMLGAVIRRGGAVAICGSCMDARGMSVDSLVPGAERGSMDVLSTWTIEADKVVVF